MHAMPFVSRQLPPPTIPALRGRDADSDTDPTFTLAETLPLEVLDAVDYAIVVVDVNLRIILANRAARQRLHGRGLAIRNDVLWPDDADDRARLESAVHCAATRNLRRMLRLGRGQAAVAAVVPLLSDAVARPPRVLLLISREHTCEPLSSDWYARNNGLTPAECRVLRALCDGHEAACIAEQFGVQVCTVRTHINTIRSKTGCSSVRELVRHVSCLPPMVRAIG